MKIKVRRAQIADIPQLVDKLEMFYNILVEKGAKDISPIPDVLRGGVTIEVGMGYNNPDLWNCLVAVDSNGVIIGFCIGIQEFCGPVEPCLKRVRIHGLYIENDTLAAPRIITAMWNAMENWAQQIGAGYFYANIHPGNQPSVRAAKACHFKHHYTQFYRPVKLETEEEVN
jgi:hypothetical protein